MTRMCRSECAARIARRSNGRSIRDSNTEPNSSSDSLPRDAGVLAAPCTQPPVQQHEHRVEGSDACERVTVRSVAAEQLPAVDSRRQQEQADGAQRARIDERGQEDPTGDPILPRDIRNDRASGAVGRWIATRSAS